MTAFAIGLIIGLCAGAYLMKRYGAKATATAADVEAAAQALEKAAKDAKG